MASVQFDHVYKRYNKVDMDIITWHQGQVFLSRSVPLVAGRVPVCVWWPV